MDPSPPLVDAHVHLFPPRVFAAIWRWFDQHAWSIKHRLHSEEVIAFLVEQGVHKLVALHYSHKPDMARALNAYVAEIARAHPEVIPLATVFPGEPDAAAILSEAFGKQGLRGVKLHCHVQAFHADDVRLDPVYTACVDAGLPAVVHAGRAPAADGYPIHPGLLGRVDAVRRVLERYPRLILVIPHLGADEFGPYTELLSEFENLYLDTAMVVSDYFKAGHDPRPTLARYPERILFGTDFPNLPYDWNVELDAIRAMKLPPIDEARILGGNALRLFGG